MFLWLLLLAVTDMKIRDGNTVLAQISLVDEEPWYL